MKKNSNTVKHTVIHALAALLAAGSLAVPTLASQEEGLSPVRAYSVQAGDQVVVLTGETRMAQSAPADDSVILPASETGMASPGGTTAIQEVHIPELAGDPVVLVTTQEWYAQELAGDPVVLVSTREWYAQEPATPAGREVDANVRTATGSVWVTGWYNPELADGVLELVNRQRAAAGLDALAFDPLLEEAAVLRALETTVNWSHTRPDGSAWSTVCVGANGENIARGTNMLFTAAQVMEGWMNSEGHRDNILNPDFTRMGVGCVQIDNSIYWVQLFGC